MRRWPGISIGERRIATTDPGIPRRLPPRRTSSHPRLRQDSNFEFPASFRFLLLLFLHFSETMPTISDNAICIRRWDFSETSQTVLLFCREIGLLRGLAKGAKRPKSRFSGGFDILTRGQVIAIVKPSNDLANIIEWHLEQVYERCRRDMKTNRICLYMIDLLQHALTEHDPHEGAFVLFTDLLDAIESGDSADQLPAAMANQVIGRVRLSTGIIARCRNRQGAADEHGGAGVQFASRGSRRRHGTRRSLARSA